jgi:DNA repair protein RadA/Sms
MSKVRIVHCCTSCGAQHPKWNGQCSTCGEWNTLIEETTTPSTTDPQPHSLPTGMSSGPVQIDQIPRSTHEVRSTGISELDHVLGGGLVPGSVTLIGGEPGIGKSTLLLQLMAWWPGRALYVSGEESTEQIHLRARRLSAVRPDLWLLAENSLPRVIAAIADLSPQLVVIDSIQTVSDPSSDSLAGSVSQVRACTQRLIAEAKTRNIPVVLVGHVTKEGGLAGPRALEHLVDTVCSFEGDRHHSLRLLRATKHRYGATGELGLFEMGTYGLVGVPDANAMFLVDRSAAIEGSAILPTVEGHRPLMVEVQALTVPAPPQVPARRVGQGVDGARLSLLLAVLQQRAKIAVGHHDTYLSTVGGVRLTDPGSDLAICCAITSSLLRHPLPSDVVILGEVGLGGELRQVSHAHKRLAEAARMGFRCAIVPEHSPGSHDIEVLRAETLRDALLLVDLSG